MTNIHNIEGKIRVIGYDDDNHGVRIFVNGKYIDNMDNRVDAAVNLIMAGLDCYELTQTTSWTGEIVSQDITYSNLDTTDEIAIKVNDLLTHTTQLTLEQEVAILNEDYEKLTSN